MADVGAAHLAQNTHDGVDVDVWIKTVFWYKI